MKKILINNLDDVNEIKKILGVDGYIPIEQASGYYVMPIPDDKYDDIRNFFNKKNCHIPKKKYTSAEYYPVRKIVFGYFDKDNIKSSFDLFRNSNSLCNC